MILLPNFLANEFRDSFKQQMNILYRGMKIHRGKVTAKQFLFHLIFLFNVSRFHPNIRFGDCDVCYLFYGKNLASPYKCSKVELICSAWVKRKRFVPVMGTTWMIPGHLKQNIYSSGDRVTVDSVRPIYPPQKFHMS